MKVSIIVPVYNVEKYVGKCLESILSQTYTEYECIVVNDGSTDGSGEIVRSYAERDARIIVIEQENRGLGAARNTGIKAAQGEYIQFVDSDDFLEPELLARCVEALENKSADMAVFKFYYYENGGRAVEDTVGDFNTGSIYTLKEQPEILFKMLPAAWSKMYRRGLFTENGIVYPEGKLYEDLGTTYRLLWRAGGILFIDKVLYNYRINREERISTRKDKKVLDIIDMMDEIIQDYCKNNLFLLYYEELKTLLFTHAFYSIANLLANKRGRAYAYALQILGYVVSVFPEYPQSKYEDFFESNGFKLPAVRDRKLRVAAKILLFPAKIWVWTTRKRLPGYTSARKLRGCES